MTDIPKLARSLSEAQRRYLTDRAEVRSPTAYSAPRWMTFPPARTHRVLMGLELIGRNGSILPLGLQVRAYLESQQT